MINHMTKTKMSKASDVSPFTWPKFPNISKTDLLIAKIFSGVKHEIEFRIGQTDFILSLPGLIDRSLLTEKIDVQIGDIQVEVWTSPNFLSQVLAVNGFKGATAEDLNENTDLVTEFLLNKALAKITSEFGADPVFTKRSAPELGLPASHVPLRITSPAGQSVGFAIAAEIDTLTRILKLAVEEEVKTTGLLKETFKWPIALLGADLEISVEDLITLETGDGLIIEDPNETAKLRSVLIDGRLLGFAVEEAGELKFTGTLKKLNNSNLSEFGIYDMINRLDDGDDASDLTVTINLEIARADITLSALQDIAIGSILPFNAELPETVRLLADNEIIAEGELVQLEGKIAVRVTKIDDM